jgi:hypothetical protein
LPYQGKRQVNQWVDVFYGTQIFRSDGKSRGKMKSNAVKGWIGGVLLAVVGTAVGAIGTYFYTLKIEERKLYLQERVAGSKEFFEGTVALWRSFDIQASADYERVNGNKPRAEELASEAQKQADKSRTHYFNARFKIGVFGDANVVHALARFWSQRKNICPNPQELRHDVAIYQAMRGAFAARGQVKDNDLIRVLFDCDMGG